MRPPLTGLRRFTYSLLPLALLVPLAGCGNADAGEGAEESPSATVTLTGPLAADGGFDMDCNIYSDRGLQLTFASGGQEKEETAGEHGRDLQIQVRINDYVGAGEYPVGIVINVVEHGAHGFKRWNGWATANIQRRMSIERGIRKQSEVSGSFEGTYQGQGGGHGTISGTFRNCAMRELIP
jgi:hypothetical protein